MEIVINGKPQLVFNCKNGQELIDFIQNTLDLNHTDYYLVCNGKRISHNEQLCGRIHLVPRVLGGKGGFGSMLRAIGAQIEKTTNREACRDLSGRRLRDINEEQRLKNWINQQAEREKEAKEKRQKKLERLCEVPKHVFKDEQYEKERSQLPEVVEDAVLQGLQASCSTKRKVTEHTSVVKTKKRKLWVGDELDDDLSLSEGEDEESESEESKKSPAPCTSSTQDSENSNKSGSTENQNVETENEHKEDSTVEATTEINTENQNVETENERKEDSVVEATTDIKNNEVHTVKEKVSEEQRVAENIDISKEISNTVEK